MLSCKPTNAPIDPNRKLGQTKLSASVDKGRYQHLVGKLIYLSHTHPDIAFVVSMVNQFIHSPIEECFEAVYQVLKYLKGS